MLARELQLPRLVLDLAEQTCVLDGERRLRGERLHQVDDVLAEAARPLAPYHQGADDAVLAQQGHRQQGAHVGPQQHVAHVVSGLAGEVADLDHAALERALSDGARIVQAPVGAADGLGELLAHAVGGRERELAARLVEGVDGAAAGIGQPAGVRQDGVEHRAQLERRVDGLADADQGAQLVERLRQLARAVGDLLLQRRVGFLEAGAHVVEAVGQALHLVARPHHDAVVELAAADARGTGRQRPDRHHHAPRQPDAGEQGETETQSEHEEGAAQRLVDRLQRLAERQVDEHQPAQRADRRRGREDVAAQPVARDGRDVDAGVARAIERHGNVRDTAEVGLAQHDADVGVGDEQAALVDHVGGAGLADLDARDHVPDELEVDLGHRHPGRAAAAGDAHGDVGLRALAEVDLAEIALVGPGVGERRVLAQVGAAAHRVHGEARHLDLLAALGVEIPHLGDGRGLAQEAQEVEAALLEPARRQEACGPAHLALDLLEELLDDGSGALRLLALHGDERLAALAVGIVHFNRGIDDERAADERHQQGGVLAEQPARLLQVLGARAGDEARCAGANLRQGQYAPANGGGGQRRCILPHRTRQGTGTRCGRHQVRSQSPHPIAGSARQATGRDGGEPANASNGSRRLMPGRSQFSATRTTVHPAA